MRYSKFLFILALTFVLIFGGMINSFATIDFDYLYLDVEQNDSYGYIVGTSEGWHVDGTAVTLTAIPYEGYAFMYWMKDVKGDGQPAAQIDNPQLNFTLTRDTDCIAYFEHVYDLSVVVDEPSMGSVSGTAPGEYPKNAPVTMTAEPNDGYRVVEWLFNNVHFSYEDSINFDMPKDNVVIKLILEEIPWFEISTFVEEEDDWGTVTGAGTYQVGDPVTLTATPARGYVFHHWEWKWCPPEIVIEDQALRCPPPFDPTSPTITFPMKECNGEFTAYFEPIEMYGVKLVTSPADKGDPELDENALPGDEEYDGYYYVGEKFNVSPNPIPHWHFVGYTWDKIQEEPSVRSSEVVILPEYDTTDPDYDFTMKPWNKELTVYYEEDHFVTATIKYLNASDVSIKPDTQEIVYIGAYSFAPPAISGYTFGVSSANASGTITDESEDFTVIHKYYVPQVITNTNTVTETVFVTVPATTAAPTTEVIPTEAVPLGAVTVMNFDEIFADEEPIETEAPVVVEEEETPLADALPQTGQLPVELFYGIGGLVSTIGLYIRRKR